MGLLLAERMEIAQAQQKARLNNERALENTERLVGISHGLEILANKFKLGRETQ